MAGEDGDRGGPGGGGPLDGLRDGPRDGLRDGLGGGLRDGLDGGPRGGPRDGLDDGHTDARTRCALAGALSGYYSALAAAGEPCAAAAQVLDYVLRDGPAPAAADDPRAAPLCAAFGDGAPEWAETLFTGDRVGGARCAAAAALELAARAADAGGRLEGGALRDALLAAFEAARALGGLPFGPEEVAAAAAGRRETPELAGFAGLFAAGRRALGGGDPGPAGAFFAPGPPAPDFAALCADE